MSAILSVESASSTAIEKELYDLDKADGRKERVRVGGQASTDTYVLASDHRILQAGVQPISYHLDGYRLSDGRFTYDLDVLGRVVRVRNASNGAIEAELGYDALSRVAVGSIAGEAFSRWFGGASWVHEIRGTNGEVRQASPHPLWPHPLCIRHANSSYFLHPDGGLSTTCVSDELGSVVERHRYGPFGAPEIFEEDGATAIALGGSVVEPMWRGMAMLGATGLYMTPQRLYDPDLGEFTSRDPLLYRDSPNPFVYAGHNPVDFADPTGLSKSPIQQSGYSIAPLPAVSGDTFQPGFAWVQYTGALNDVFNPDTPIWAKVALGALAVAGAPLALVERTLTEVGNLGVGVGEHIARGHMLVKQGEGLEAADDFLQAVANFALAFLSLASFAEGTATSGAPVPKKMRPPPEVPLVPEPPPQLPTVDVHYTPILKATPQDANWARFNIEWVMEDVGYFTRGERLAEDSAARASARRWMDKQGFDRTGLQAMHPLDDIAAGYFRRPGEVGTTYYFGDAGVNGEFGREFGNQLNRLGVKIGDRFQVRFTGSWPSYTDVPPIAPPASPPGLR
jgi:RHS repeat-associated protein